MSNLIDSITNPLKTAGDTAQKLIGLRDTAKFGDAIIELQAQIMSAQQGALAAQQREAAMTEEIRNLKSHVTELEAWDREKERYELAELPPGVFVYTVKEEARGGEPPHKLCANCFQQKRKSFLNSGEPTNGITRLHCPSCGFEDQIGHFRAPHVERHGGSWMSS